MKSTILVLLPIACLLSISSLFISYSTAYYFLKDGFTEWETILLFIVPSVIYFVVIITIGTVLISKDNTLGLNKVSSLKTGVLLFCLIILVSIILDYCYLLIDNLIPLKMAESLFIIDSQTRENIDDLDEYKNLPFFLQNIFQNALAILLASIFSFIIANRLNSK
jgi:hypothetical protein